MGRFELAHGGTIFLDEIGEMRLALQVKLLRVLQEREFERIGGTRTIKVDVRILAATNKNLEDLVERHQFRDDLYWRLNVIPMTLPPLRERLSDIPLLVAHLLHMNRTTLVEKVKKLTFHRI
jgi:transcriptional regulator with GAF, ATPase, and Fis domain